MNVNIHGTEIVYTGHEWSGEVLTINAEVKGTDGGTVNMFFSCVEDLELLAHELHCLAELINDESGYGRDICGACQGSGEGISGPSKCLTCGGLGEVA